MKNRFNSPTTTSTCASAPPPSYLSNKCRRFAGCLVATVCATVSLTAPAENVVYRNDLGSYTSTQLQGDNTPTTLFANWEAELTNPDGNQNQMSMAKCGDALFVCVSYFDDIDGRKDALFLRRYAAADGTADDIVITLPDDFKAGTDNFHTIASDTEGNLVAALISGTKATSVESVKVTLYRVDVDNRSLDPDTRTEIDIPAPVQFNVSDDYNPWMERIDLFEGDFQAGTFRFAATMGWRISTSHFTYSRVLIDYDITRESHVSLDRVAFAVEKTSSDSQNLWPDIAPLSDNAFVVTRTLETTGGPYYAPTIYTAADGQTSDNLSGNWASNAQMANCRGFYPFIHNGHLLAVFGQQHDTADGGSGARFRIISLPVNDSFNNQTMLWDLPATPFPSDASSHLIYPRYYRQLAVIETPEAIPAADNDTPRSTNIYLCSPGCGIGSYTITTDAATTPDIPTSILSITGDHAHNIPTLQGRTLYLPGSINQSTAELFDPTGRHVATIPISGNEADLSALSIGLYIVRVGEATLKICLR